jgi:hypothetical protein
LGYYGEVIALLKLYNRPEFIKELIPFVADYKDVGVITKLIHQVQEVICSCSVE